tara:strand:+ start:13987 stop:14691 length:705 start_codon:yes stop_codon:yes gene_type:complete
VAKELTHRADELKKIGWSQEDLYRYIELWEYRQRWGAINLEREDRQFLRKAESVLPVISKVKTSVKKSIHEKSYYRWLAFYLNEMCNAESAMNIPGDSVGLWKVLIEEELRILEYYQPVLGLPDTLKAKLLKPLREEIIQKSQILYKSNINLSNFDFNAPLISLNEDYSKNWKPLRDDNFSEDQNYPVINSKNLESFRNEVREMLLPAIKDNFPSLANTDKPAPPKDWEPKSDS